MAANLRRPRWGGWDEQFAMIARASLRKHRSDYKIARKELALLEDEMTRLNGMGAAPSKRVMDEHAAAQRKVRTSRRSLKWSIRTLEDLLNVPTRV